MNDVILIGGSHHNGLGLARSFGICGINPYGIIIGANSKKSFIRKSKYWKDTFAIDSESQLITFLMQQFKKNDEKPVIIPWSDGAALELDSHFNTLSEYFILPSMNGKEGEIVKLQDKYEQIKLAEKYGLPMAKSWIIKFVGGGTAIPEDTIFPCILKPVTSAEGDKLDITKCNSQDELSSALKRFQEKGYKRILCQEYVFFDYEFVFCGSCSSDSAYTISKNVRNWPVIGGTNSFFQCIVDSRIEKVCQSILHSLETEGFKGLFDIEMFCKGDRIILNEVNWRNTGNSFFALGTGVHYAVIWYYAMIGKSEICSDINHRCNDPNQYAMNESTDLRHVIFCKYPINKWFKDFKKTQSFALWFKSDLKPTLRQYLHLLHVLIFRNKHI